MINLGIVTSRHFPFLGGMEYAVHNFSNALTKLNNINVNVACATNKNLPLNFHYEYNCLHAKSFSYLTPYLFKYNQRKMIKENNVNILHGPMLHEGGYWATRLGKKYNIPSVINSRGSDFQTERAIGYGALLNEHNASNIKLALRNSDHIVALSKLNKEVLIQLGADPSKVSIIHNGILIDEINKIKFIDQRIDWGFYPDDFVIITVGRNSKVKRMELLFESLKKIKSYKKIKCICIGPNKNIRNLIKKNGLESVVKISREILTDSKNPLVPPYPNLINSYRSSNLFISCSYFEAFSNATTDALACGIPVLIGSKHGVRDILVPSETGFIMNEETSTELADMIVDCYKNFEKFKEKTKIIQDSVSHLSWKNIAQKYFNLYSKILNT